MSEPTAALADRAKSYSKALADHAAALEPLFQITKKQQDRDRTAYMMARAADLLDECAKALRTRQPADTEDWSWLYRHSPPGEAQPADTAAVERVSNAVIMALWPVLGGNHTDAELWNEIGEAVTGAIAAMSPEEKL